MTRTPNPPAFVAAVHDHLADARDQFNYEALLHTFLDNERFHRWTEVVARRRPLAGAHVLSSGCGLGGSLLAWHDAGAARVAGVEVDDDYVRMAALRVAELPTVTVTRYDGARLPFDDASFDIVESMDVIEHVADPSAYLAELLRVLRPDGIVLLVTPNRLWPVEQHLSIVGPPWLPVGVADRVWGALARLPWLGRDRRFRFAKLTGMRTQNLSLRRLRALARRHGLHLELLVGEPDDERWPLPVEPGWVRRLQRHRIGKFVAPSRTLAVVLHRRRPGQSRR